MENPLYIRMRGRVMGPYDEERLRSLARRGQLSQIHELSEDAVNWVRASTFPELFACEQVLLVQQAQGEIRDVGGTESLTSRPLSRRWWYRKNGSDVGPVDQGMLESLLASGDVTPDSLVWGDGMPQWVPARQVECLASAETAPWLPQKRNRSGSTDAEKENELPTSLCKAAVGSRPWVVFIAIVTFVYAALSVLGGGYLLILGANVHAAPVVATGLFSIIYGGLAGFGGVLLFSYASRLASLGYGKKAIVMEKAMDCLRHFWIFVGIITIVMLAFLVFVMVWAVAIGGTLPGMLRDL